MGHNNEKLIIPPVLQVAILCLQFPFLTMQEQLAQNFPVRSSMALCDLVWHEPNLAPLGVHPELLFGPALSRHLVS